MLNLYVKNLTVQNILCIAEGTDMFLSLLHVILHKRKIKIFPSYKNSYLQKLNQKLESNRVYETRINVKLLHITKSILFT